MKNIIDPLIERIQNFQFSDTFEIDEDDSFQTEEQVKDDNLIVNHFDVDNDNLQNDEA
jgi:hypothetical protein